MPEVRIPLKEATAKNFLMLNRAVAAAEQRVQDSLRPIFTEHEIPEGSRAVQVTENPPYELVVLIEDKKAE